MKKIISLVIAFFVFTSYLHATILINSADGISGVLTFSTTQQITTTTGQSQSVGAKAYLPATGDFYVGLAVPSATPTLNIAKFSRPVKGQQLFFNGAAGANLSSQPIDFIALINALGKTDPLLVGVTINTPDMLNQTSLAVQTTLPTNQGIIASSQSTTLLGTSTASTQNGPAIYGIAGIAAGIARDTGYNYIFAAVSNLLLGGTNGFGNLGSGIAVLNAILTIPSLPNTPSIQINQVAAQPDQTGIKAARLDPSSTQVSIGEEATITLDRVSLFWDDTLQRLYIGLQLATANDPASGARSVVVGNLQANEQGELNLNDFLPNTSLVPTQTTNIVGVIGAADTLAAAQVQVMHTSAGPSYLILQGGNGVITTNPAVPEGTVGNLIWALPLVDLQDFTNANQGLLANKNMFNATTHRFEVPAAVNADLTDIDDEFAQVGAGPLPLQPYTPISGAGSGSGPTTGLPMSSLDINVSGDTVYVAIASAQTDTDDTGVYYSQAMFDNVGQIIRWTPWAKRAFTFNAFPTVPENKGEVRFINIDPVTGNLVGVEGKNGQAVTMTAWNTTPFAAHLPMLINQNLASGCLSVLDLDQTTRGLATDGPSRYTLFGGTKSVIFARTILSRVQTPPYDSTNGHPAPQKLTTFINRQGNLVPYNFLVTSVGDACINVLEYSRRLTTEGNTNYFFAGANSGLYVFADPTGQGFNSSELGAPTLGVLNATPFSTGAWQRISTLPGSIVDIKTSGAALYVMTVDRDSNGNMQSLIYSIEFQDNISTMFDPSNLVLIAQSQVGNLATVKIFYGMQIINMDNQADTGNSEQLIIATNNGLYMSFTTGGVEIATDQVTANWQLIPDSQDTLWRGIAGVDTPFPSTVWPFSLTDPTGLKIFNRSNITQLTGGNTVGDDGLTPELSAFNPENFNSNGSLPGFNSFNPITYFSTDGLRRFFITQPHKVPGQNSSLVVSPFDVAASRLTNPTTIANLALNSVTTLNWVKQIGATGKLMAGTNKGVVALD